MLKKPQTLLALVGLTLSLFTIPYSYSATLLVDAGGQLTGATGVNVSGTLYDVSFQDGSCIETFSGCDESTDFMFTSYSDATNASLALFDQVFINTLSGEFDNSPELTLGCDVSICMVFTVYGTGIDPYSGYLAALASNAENHLEGNSSNMSWLNPSFDLSDDGLSTYAVWSLTEVPLPATGYLFLSALVGLLSKKRLFN